MTTLTPTTPPEDGTGHALDRPAALDEVFSPALRRAALRHAGHTAQRSCVLTHETAR